MKVTITLAPAAGADLETFSLFKDTDNLPFALNVTRAELEIGQTYVLPDGTLQVRIVPDGRCTDSVIQEILYIVPPDIVTVSVDNVTQTEAEANGDLVSFGTAPGGVTAKGIVWGINAFPTLSNNLILDPSTALGAYIGLMTPLIAGTPYNFRAFATTAQGTFYGINLAFNSSGAQIPIVSTQAVEPYNQTTGTGHGTIVDPGSQTITERGIVWALTTNPTIADFKAIGAATSPFEGSMTGLSPNTLYYVKAYATVNIGTYYGNEVLLTTLADPGVAPTVVTGSVVSVEYTSAVVEGNVLAEGTEPVTEKGIVWATTPSPVIGQGGVTKVPGGISTGAGSYVSNLISMTPLTVPPTEFFARAYAISTVDTVYGADVSVEYVPVCTPFVGSAIEQDIFQLPPTVLNVVAIGSVTLPQVDVSWDASLDLDVVAYILERNDDGGAYAELTTQAGITFVDTTSLAGVDYCYRVKAVNGDGESPDWSIIDCYMPLRAWYITSSEASPGSACPVDNTTISYSDSAGSIPVNGDLFFTDALGTLPIAAGYYKYGSSPSVGGRWIKTVGPNTVSDEDLCPTGLTELLLSTTFASKSLACAEPAATTYWFDGNPFDTGRPQVGDVIHTDDDPETDNFAVQGYYKTADNGYISIVDAVGTVSTSGGCLATISLGAFGSTAQIACDTPIPWFTAYSDNALSIQRPLIGDTIYTNSAGTTTLTAGFYKTNDDTGSIKVNASGLVILSDDCGAPA